MKTDLATAIKGAFDYLAETEIPSDVWNTAVKRRVFSAKAGDGLDAIRAAYHDSITSALTTYFEGGSVTGPTNEFKRAAIEALGGAFDLGWVEGGGELPPDADALAWFNPFVESELGFIQGVFVQAKELRKEDGFDFFAWVTSMADSYVRSLSGVYNAALMMAKKNQILTWHLGQTEKHCDTCASLDGKSHRASWYIARDYIPRKPGAGMDCKGYNCDCKFTDKKGNEVTI